MKYAREYRRHEILSDSLQFREGWIELIYSKHALDRLKERLKGDLELYPRQVNISKLNINKGYSYDGVHLYKVVIRLEFKKSEWIYLVILPKKRIVKSVWFEQKSYESKARNRTAMEAVSKDVGSSSENQKMLEL